LKARDTRQPDSEAEAYEHEYPGSSWLATTTLSEIGQTSHLVDDAMTTVARKYGLSHAAGNALAVIEGEGAPLPAGEISARMLCTTGAMTSLLDTLERKGLIVRLSDPDDRRRVLVDITSAAQELLDKLLPEVQQICTVVMSRLSNKQVEQLRATLAAVRRGLLEFPDDLPAPRPRRAPRRLRRGV
jgi:MarR family 2-MHQ and catechol resistance regulon transcriptional repressor